MSPQAYNSSIINPADRRRRAIALVIWAAYFIVPNDAGGLVHGLPLGPIESAALLALGWLAIFGGRIRFAWGAAVLMIVTTVAGAAIPGSPGFRARYFASIDGTGTPERSSGFTDRAYTRIDESLDFRPGGPELPLNFFNDNSRFSFFQVRPRSRNDLEFSVRWSGFWWLTQGVNEIYVDAPQAVGEVFVDGQKRMGQVDIGPGWHRLDVSLSSPYGAPRRFSAGTIRLGLLTPFDSLTVYTQQIRDWQVQSARVLRVARTVSDLAALVLVLIAWATSCVEKIGAVLKPAADRERRQQVIALFTAAAAIDAWRVAWPWATRVMILVGGDDTLTYETFARDIMFNGILMSGGKPLGHGEPFYYQAFYPYFLALEHVIGGEFMFGVVLIQRLLAVYAIVKLVEISIRFTTERAWMVALPIAAAFVWWKFAAISAQPLNESLYVPLLVISTASLIRLVGVPLTGRAIWTGAISGFTAITRSTVLVGWLIAWPAAWLALKGSAARSRVLAVVIVSFLAVLSLVSMRNWIVARVPSPIPTEGAITLLGGNEPPPGLEIAPGRSPMYQRFGIGDKTALVIDYAIQQPRLFAINLLKKAVFVLGFYEPYVPGWGYSPVYILTWTSALAGLWLAVRRRQGSVWPILIPALIALTQYIAIVVVYPKGERLVVPIHTLLIPYSAAAAWFALNSRSSEAANVNRIASRTNT